MAGWYPDPVTLGSSRYWDGKQWTSDVSYQGRRFRDSTPLQAIEAAANKADAEIVRSYLSDAMSRGVITEEVANALRRDIARILVGGLDVPPAPAQPRPAVNQVPLPTAPRPTPPPTPTAAPRPVPQYTPPAPVVIEPGVIAKWWARTRDAVVSDLAVHGLAYLGVVLMFAGVFGLFAFSMSDVQPVWRGVAVLSAPTAFLGAAWYLRHRRATAVAAALSLLGGAIMPIAAIASLTDGSQIPPDLHGNALPIGQGVLCAAIAAATGFAARRWPASLLRFTAAPTLWLGVGGASGLLRDHLPSGEAVAPPAALQISASLVAAALPPVVLRRGAGSASRGGPVSSRGRAARPG